MEKITVIGGGNGGFAAASDLTLRGNRVTLFDLPQFEAGLEEIRSRGGIDMEVFPGNGLEGGFAKLFRITTDIEEALFDTDLVFIIAPAYSLSAIAPVIAPHFHDGQIVSLCPGNFGGAMYLMNVVKKSGNQANIQYAEFSCMMYATRKKTPSSVWVRGYKHNLGVAMFPNRNSEEAFSRIKGVYPYIKRYNNVIETGMSNTNTTGHTSLMLLNAANIDNKEDRLFYRECSTQSLDNILEVLDAERLQLNNIPGMNLLPLAQISLEWYEHQGAKGKTSVEQLHSLPHFAYSKMPTTMDYRYVTEDVPFGLIPCAEFLEQMGYPHRYTTSLIDVLCAVCKKDFYQDARTMEQLGIKGMDAKQVMEFMETGK